KTAQTGFRSIMELLVQQRSVDLSITDRNGENALDIAEANGYSELSQYLRSKGLVPKKKFNSNMALGLYFAYLTLSIILTIWVARTLFKNGRIFLLDTFKEEKLADSINHVLVVGFY